MCAAVSTAYLPSSSPCSSPREIDSRNEDEDWESRRERREKKKISPSPSCTVNADSVLLRDATSYGVRTPGVSLHLSFHQQREENEKTHERGRKEDFPCADFSSLRRKRIIQDRTFSSCQFTRSASDFCLSSSSSSSSSISKANVVRFSSLSSSSSPETEAGFVSQRRMEAVNPPSPSPPLRISRDSRLPYSSSSSSSALLKEGGQDDVEEKKKLSTVVSSSSFSPSSSSSLAYLPVDKDEEVEKMKMNGGEEEEEEERRRCLTAILKARGMLDRSLTGRPPEKEEGREDEEEEREALKEEESRERSFLSVSEDGEEAVDEENRREEEREPKQDDEEEEMKSLEEGEEREEGDHPACVEEAKVSREERREDEKEEEEEKREKWISRDEFKEGREEEKKKKLETLWLHELHSIEGRTEGGRRGKKFLSRQRQSFSFSEDFSSSSSLCCLSASFPTSSMMASTADHISFSSSLPSSSSFSFSPRFSSGSSSSASSCFAYICRGSLKESATSLVPSSSLRRSFSSPVSLSSSFSSSSSSSSPPPPARVSSASSPSFPSSPASALPFGTPPTCSSSPSPPSFLSSSSSSSSSLSPCPSSSSSPSPLASSSSCSPPPLLSSSSPPLPSSSSSSSPPPADLLTKLPVSVLSLLSCEFLSFFDVVRLSKVSKSLLRLSQKQRWIHRQISAGALHTLFVSSPPPPPPRLPSPSASLPSSSSSFSGKVSSRRPSRSVFSSPFIQHAKEEKGGREQKNAKSEEEEEVRCPSSSSSSSFSCTCACHDDEDIDEVGTKGEESSLSILLEEEEDDAKKRNTGNEERSDEVEREKEKDGESEEDAVFRRERYRCGCCSRDDYDGGGPAARRLRRRCWLFARGRVDCLSLQIAKELQWMSLSSFSSSLSPSILLNQRQTDSTRRMKKKKNYPREDEMSASRASREKEREEEEDDDEEGNRSEGRRRGRSARSETRGGEEEVASGVWAKESLEERESEQDRKNEASSSSSFSGGRSSQVKRKKISSSSGKTARLSSSLQTSSSSPSEVVARREEPSWRQGEEEGKVEDRDKISDSSRRERNGEEEEERKEKNETAVDKAVDSPCIYPYPFMPHINFDAVISRYSSSSSSSGSLLKTSRFSSSFHRGENTRQEASSDHEEEEDERRRERKDSGREEGGGEEEEEELLPWPCAEVYAYLRECRLDESRADEIKRDVPRTFPHHAYFRRDEGQKHLYEILHAYACLSPSTGYCQGMNFLAGGLLVLTGDSVSAFWCFLILLRCLDFHLLFASKIPLLHARVFQFNRILRSFLPELSQHLLLNSLSVDFFSQQWLMTCFSYHVDLPTVGCVWDSFFLHGWKALFKAAVVLLKRYQSKILQKHTLDDILHVVKESDERQTSSSSSPSSSPCFFRQREKEANRLSCSRCGCCRRRKGNFSLHSSDRNRSSSSSCLALVPSCPSPECFFFSSSHSPVGSFSSARSIGRSSSSLSSSSSSSRKAFSFLSEIEDLEWRSTRSKEKTHRGEEEEVPRRQSSRDSIYSSSFSSQRLSSEKIANACNSPSSASFSVIRKSSLLHSCSSDHVQTSSSSSLRDQEEVSTPVKIHVMKKTRMENHKRDSEKEISQDNQMKTGSPPLLEEAKKMNVYSYSSSSSFLPVEKQRKSLYSVYPSSFSFPCCPSCRYMTFLNEMKRVKITNRLLSTLSRSFLTNKLLVLLDGLPSSGLLGEASLIKNLSLSSSLSQSTERRREEEREPGEEQTGRKGLIILKRRETGEIRKEEANNKKKKNRRRSYIEKKPSVSEQVEQKLKIKDDREEEEENRNTTAVFSSASSFSSSLRFFTKFLPGGLKRGNAKHLTSWSPDNRINSCDNEVIRTKKEPVESPSPRPVRDNQATVVPRGVHTPQGFLPVAPESRKTSHLLPPLPHPSDSQVPFAPSRPPESFRVKKERQTSSPDALEEEQRRSERVRNTEKTKTEEEDKEEEEEESRHLPRESVDVPSLKKKKENKRISPVLSRDPVSSSRSSFSRSPSSQEDCRQVAPSTTSLARNAILLPSAAFADERRRRGEKTKTKNDVSTYEEEEEEQQRTAGERERGAGLGSPLAGYLLLDDQRTRRRERERRGKEQQDEEEEEVVVYVNDSDKNNEEEEEESSSCSPFSSSSSSSSCTSSPTICLSPSARRRESLLDEEEDHEEEKEDRIVLQSKLKNFGVDQGTEERKGETTSASRSSHERKNEEADEKEEAKEEVEEAKEEKESSSKSRPSVGGSPAVSACKGGGLPHHRRSAPSLPYLLSVYPPSTSSSFDRGDPLSSCSSSSSFSSSSSSSPSLISSSQLSVPFFSPSSSLSQSFTDGVLLASSALSSSSSSSSLSAGDLHRCKAREKRLCVRKTKEAKKNKGVNLFEPADSLERRSLSTADSLYNKSDEHLLEGERNEGHATASSGYLHASFSPRFSSGSSLRFSPSPLLSYSLSTPVSSVCTPQIRRSRRRHQSLDSVPYRFSPFCLLRPTFPQPRSFDGEEAKQAKDEEESSFSSSSGAKNGEQCLNLREEEEEAIQEEMTGHGKKKKKKISPSMERDEEREESLQDDLSLDQQKKKENRKRRLRNEEDEERRQGEDKRKGGGGEEEEVLFEEDRKEEKRSDGFFDFPSPSPSSFSSSSCAMTSTVNLRKGEERRRETERISGIYLKSWEARSCDHQHDRQSSTEREAGETREEEKRREREEKEREKKRATTKKKDLHGAAELSRGSTLKRKPSREEEEVISSFSSSLSRSSSSCLHARPSLSNGEEQSKRRRRRSRSRTGRRRRRRGREEDTGVVLCVCVDMRSLITREYLWEGTLLHYPLSRLCPPPPHLPSSSSSSSFSSSSSCREVERRGGGVPASSSSLSFPRETEGEEEEEEEVFYSFSLLDPFHDLLRKRKLVFKAGRRRRERRRRGKPRRLTRGPGGEEEEERSNGERGKGEPDEKEEREERKSIIIMMKKKKKSSFVEGGDDGPELSSFYDAASSDIYYQQKGDVLDVEEEERATKTDKMRRSLAHLSGKKNDAFERTDALKKEGQQEGRRGEAFLISRDWSDEIQGKNDKCLTECEKRKEDQIREEQGTRWLDRHQHSSGVCTPEPGSKEDIATVAPQSDRRKLLACRRCEGVIEKRGEAQKKTTRDRGRRTDLPFIEAREIKEERECRDGLVYDVHLRGTKRDSRILLKSSPSSRSRRSSSRSLSSSSSRLRGFQDRAGHTGVYSGSRDSTRYPTSGERKEERENEEENDGDAGERREKREAEEEEEEGRVKPSDLLVDEEEEEEAKKRTSFSSCSQAFRGEGKLNEEASQPLQNSLSSSSYMETSSSSSFHLSKSLFSSSPSNEPRDISSSRLSSSPYHGFVPHEERQPEKTPLQFSSSSSSLSSLSSVISPRLYRLLIKSLAQHAHLSSASSSFSLLAQDAQRRLFFSLKEEYQIALNLGASYLGGCSQGRYLLLPIDMMERCRVRLVDLERQTRQDVRHFQIKILSTERLLLNQEKIEKQQREKLSLLLQQEELAEAMKEESVSRLEQLMKEYQEWLNATRRRERNEKDRDKRRRRRRKEDDDGDNKNDEEEEEEQQQQRPSSSSFSSCQGEEEEASSSFSSSSVSSFHHQKTSFRRHQDFFSSSSAASPSVSVLASPVRSFFRSLFSPLSSLAGRGEGKGRTLFISSLSPSSSSSSSSLSVLRDESVKKMKSLSQERVETKERKDFQVDGYPTLLESASSSVRTPRPVMSIFPGKGEERKDKLLKQTRGFFSKENEDEEKKKEEAEKSSDDERGTSLRKEEEEAEEEEEEEEKKKKELISSALKEVISAERVLCKKKDLVTEASQLVHVIRSEKQDLLNVKKHLQESLQEFIISQEDRRTFLVSQLIEKCGVWCRDLLSFHRPPGGLQPHPPLSPDKPVYLEKLLRSLLSMASRALEEEEKKKKAREKLPG